MNRFFSHVIPQLAAPAVVLMILTGCGGGGSDLEEIPQADNALLSRHFVKPGEECRQGGWRIDNGFDTNGNGVLDDDEVIDSKYNCDDGK